MKVLAIAGALWASAALAAEPTLRTIQYAPFRAGEGASHALALVGDFIASCQLTTPTRVIRYAKADLTQRAQVDLPGHGQCAQMLAIGGALYVLAPAAHLTVTRVDPTTMIATDVVNDLQEGDGGTGSMATDGVYLYVAFGSSRVAKYRMADWTKVAAVNLTGLYNAHAAAWDSTMNVLWLTGMQSSDDVFSSWIARVGPQLNFTAVAFSGEQSVTDDLAVGPSYVIAGREGGGRLLRINKTTLAWDAIGIGSPLTSYAVTTLGAGAMSAWVPSNPGLLIAVDPATEALQQYHFDQPGESGPNELVFDTDGTGYATFFSAVPGIAHFALPGGTPPTPIPPTPGSIIINCPNGVAPGSVCVVLP